MHKDNRKISGCNLKTSCVDEGDAVTQRGSLRRVINQNRCIRNVSFVSSNILQGREDRDITRHRRSADRCVELKKFFFLLIKRTRFAIGIGSLGPIDGSRDNVELDRA